MEKTPLFGTDVRDTSHRAMIQPRLQPLVKWAGGKEKELKYILPNLPKHFENYYEPFVGGGAVYTAIQATLYKPLLKLPNIDKLIAALALLLGGVLAYFGFYKVVS